MWLGYQENSGPWDHTKYFNHPGVGGKYFGLNEILLGWADFRWPGQITAWNVICIYINMHIYIYICTQMHAYSIDNDRMYHLKISGMFFGKLHQMIGPLAIYHSSGLIDTFLAVPSHTFSPPWVRLVRPTKWQRFQGDRIASANFWGISFCWESFLDISALMCYE